MQIHQPNFNFFFRIQTAQYTIYYLKFLQVCFLFFTLYNSVAKGVPILVFMIFLIPTFPFFVFTSQKSSQLVGKYLCRTLSNRIRINKFRVLSYFSFYQFFRNYHPNLIISTFGKNILLIPLWPTELAEFKNLAKRTESDLT